MRLTFRSIAWATVGTLFLMAPLAAFSAEKTVADAPSEHNWAYTEEASSLLKQIRGLSDQLTHNSESLRIHSHQGRLDASSHAVQLNRIRKHVNAMGNSLDRLDEIQNTIAPWQQKALARITPHAVALAESTREAIAYHTERRDNFWAPAYTESVRALSDHAERINETARLFLKHAQSTDRLEALERQLEYMGV